MDWKEFVKDEVLLSETAKEYFGEIQTQTRHRKEYFEKLSMVGVNG